MQVSIIIVNYNTKQLTLDCLRSIYEHSKGVSFEVIVVDNASSDDSVLEIKEKYPLVTVIESTENLGFGRANNLGVSYAKGEFIFLLNSDTLFKNNVLYYFMEAYDKEMMKNKKIGVIGAQMQDIDGLPCSSYNYFLSASQDIISLIKHMIGIKNSFINLKIDAEIIEVDWVVGADMFLKKDLYENQKGFDPAFFMYHEEVDLQKRILSSGYRNYLITKPQLVHLEGGSTNKKKSNWKRMLVDRSRFIYYKKHSKGIEYKLYRFIFFIIRFPSLFNGNYTPKENFEYIKNLLK